MAKFGGGGGSKLDLGIGKFPSQIKAVETAEGKGFQDKPPTAQFKWGLAVYVNGSWEAKSIWTGQAFSDMAAVKDAQYISKLTRLVRAVQGAEALPTNAEDAEAWDERSMIGGKFFIVIGADPETGAAQDPRFAPYVEKAPAPAAPKPAAAKEPKPAAKKAEPVETAPVDGDHDPFTSEAPPEPVASAEDDGF